MEALVGVTAALLTIYDMCKAVDKGMTISDVKLLEKTKATVAAVYDRRAKKRGAHRDAATSMQIQVGIITISDRASAGDYDDLGGPALNRLRKRLAGTCWRKRLCRTRSARFRRRFDRLPGKVAA